MSPSDALRKLMDGNERFSAGRPRSRSSIERVRALAEGQSPFATVLACADSRVPVEMLFDQDPGDVFVVRVAGNFVTDAGLGSIEYAVAVLKSPLVLVLGHSGCGAVQAAIELVRDGKTFPGHIQVLAEAIAPAARSSRSNGPDWPVNAVAQNVRDNVGRLKSTPPIMSAAVEKKEITLAAGVYDLATAKVRLL